jgi:hypothetical protein
MRCVVLIACALVASVAPASARADEPGPPPKKSLRRPPPGPVEVEVVDLTENERDPQFFALGAHIGGGYLTNTKSGGQGAAHAALTFAFGLGPGGRRVPWTLEPWVAFAITYGVLLEKGGHPNRFSEIGVRAIYRFEQGFLANRWVSLGAGAVWTSRRPSSGFIGTRQCFDDPDAATAAGLDCSGKQSISPGLLLDIGFGLHEWTTRRVRWGFALRTPIQISAAPGFAVFGTLYGQVGTL